MRKVVGEKERKEGREKRTNAGSASLHLSRCSAPRRPCFVTAELKTRAEQGEGKKCSRVVSVDGKTGEL